MRALLSYLFGHDVFISYARQDALGYAARLANELVNAGLAVFIDQLGTPARETVPEVVLRRCRMAHMLVVIASPGARDSQAIEDEIRAFPCTERPVVVIDVEQSRASSRWRALVVGVAGVTEGALALESSQPSREAMGKVREAATFTTREVAQRRMVLATSLVTVALVCIAIWQGISIADTRDQLGALAREVSVKTSEAKELNIAIGTATQAISALKEAEAQAGDRAREAETRADAATTRAKQAQDLETRAMAASLVAEGRVSLVQAPHVAVAKAFEARKLAQTAASAELLRDAVRRFPPWARVSLVPDAKQGSFFMAPLPSSSDMVAVAPDMSRIAMAPAVQLDALDWRQLKILTVPQGSTVGAIPLAPGARLLHNGNVTGRLMVVMDRDSVPRIYDLLSAKPGQPLWTGASRSVVVCSRDRNACVAASDGTLCVVTPGRNACSAIGAESGLRPLAINSEGTIFVAPSRTSSLAAFGAGLDGTWKRTSSLEVPCPSGVADVQMDNTGGRVVILCNGLPTRLFAARTTDTRATLVMEKPSGDNRRSEEMAMQVSADADTVLVYRTSCFAACNATAVRINWGMENTEQIRPVGAFDLEGDRKQGHQLGATQVSISPNGALALLSGAVYVSGMGVGVSATFLPSYSTELWDLGTYRPAEWARPQGIELATGGLAATRLGFSHDASAAVAWAQDPAQALFFRLNAARRFTTPCLAGEDGADSCIWDAPGEALRAYDFLRNTRIDIPSRLQGSAVLGARYDDAKGSVLAILSDGLAITDAALSPRRRVTTTAVHDWMVHRHAVALVHRDEVSVWRADDLQHIVTLPLGRDVDDRKDAIGLTDSGDAWHIGWHAGAAKGKPGVLTTWTIDPASKHATRLPTFSDVADNMFFRGRMVVVSRGKDVFGTVTHTLIDAQTASPFVDEYSAPLAEAGNPGKPLIVDGAHSGEVIVLFQSGRRGAAKGWSMHAVRCDLASRRCVKGATIPFAASYARTWLPDRRGRALVLLWDYPRTSYALADALTGDILWKGANADYARIPPRLRCGPHRCTGGHTAFQRAVLREMAMGGFRDVGEVTLVRQDNHGRGSKGTNEE